MTDVVVCAHNEQATIGQTVDAILGAAGAGVVIVVADACTDDTAALASLHGAYVVPIDSGGDKGTAMACGLDVVTTPQVAFIDADLTGLTSDHVTGLLNLPPAGGQVVGLTEVAALVGRLPSISGERRLPADLARGVPLAGAGWRAETLINVAVAEAGLPWRHYLMHGVTNPARPKPGEWLEVAAVTVRYAPQLWSYTLHPGGILARTPSVV